MLPLFLQPNPEVVSGAVHHEVPEAAGSSDSGVSDVPPPVPMQTENRHDYGCLATIADYDTVADAELEPIYPHLAHEYRIYVDFARPAPATSTSIWLLPRPRVAMAREKRMDLEVRFEDEQRISHWDRLYVWNTEDDTDAFWTVRSKGRGDGGVHVLHLVDVGDGAVSLDGPADIDEDLDEETRERIMLEHEAHDARAVAMASVFTDGANILDDGSADMQRLIDDGTVVVAVVISEVDTGEAVRGEIRRLTAPAPLVPARLCGITGRYQPMQLFEFATLFTAATVLNGPGSIIVQPAFYKTRWRPGDLVYMRLSPPAENEVPRDMQRFNVTYHQEWELAAGPHPPGSAYCVVGVYIEQDAHPNVYCARLALSDCPSAVFYPLE